MITYKRFVTIVIDVMVALIWVVIIHYDTRSKVTLTLDLASYESSPPSKSGILI